MLSASRLHLIRRPIWKTRIAQPTGEKEDESSPIAIPRPMPVEQPVMATTLPGRRLYDIILDLYWDRCLFSIVRYYVSSSRSVKLYLRYLAAVCCQGGSMHMTISTTVSGKHRNGTRIC